MYILFLKALFSSTFHSVRTFNGTAELDMLRIDGELSPLGAYLLILFSSALDDLILPGVYNDTGQTTLESLEHLTSL